MSEPRQPTDLHTPGPWTAEVSDFLGIIVYAEKCQSMIAPCNSKGAEDAVYVENVEQQAANARLIAAAPSLLALAKQFAADCPRCLGLGRYEADGDFSRVATEDCPKCADIRAAIAKAEGRANV